MKLHNHRLERICGKLRFPQNAQADVRLKRIIMSIIKTWFITKLVEPCVCSSGRTYRQCCFRRECAYFVVGTAVAIALFGAHEWPMLLAAVPVLILIAYLIKKHYDHEKSKDRIKRETEAEQQIPPYQN